LVLPVGGRYRGVLTAVIIMALLWLDALGGKTDNYEKLFFQRSSLIRSQFFRASSFSLNVLWMK